MKINMFALYHKQARKQQRQGRVICKRNQLGRVSATVNTYISAAT